MPKGKHQNQLRGSRHPRWNHGKILSEEGYVKIRVGIGHPLADPNGYAYEHLIVWASAGRPLPGPGQILHHGNEDKQDNRLDNLELKTRPDHNAHHNAIRGRNELGQFNPAVSR